MSDEAYPLQARCNNFTFPWSYKTVFRPHGRCRSLIEKYSISYKAWKTQSKGSRPFFSSVKTGFRVLVFRFNPFSFLKLNYVSKWIPVVCDRPLIVPLCLSGTSAIFYDISSQCFFFVQRSCYSEIDICELLAASGTILSPGQIREILLAEN